MDQQKNSQTQLEGGGILPNISHIAVKDKMREDQSILTNNGPYRLFQVRTRIMLRKSEEGTRAKANHSSLYPSVATTGGCGENGGNQKEKIRQAGSFVTTGGAKGLDGVRK